MCFGDDLNDVSMIQIAGHGIAMGNANKTLKEHADYITKHIDEDGFEYALKEYKVI